MNKSLHLVWHFFPLFPLMRLYWVTISAFERILRRQIGTRHEEVIADRLTPTARMRIFSVAANQPKKQRGWTHKSTTLFSVSKVAEGLGFCLEATDQHVMI